MDDTTIKLEFERCYRDAKKKATELPARIKAEYQLAESEGRQPFPVQPLTEIRADLVVKACELAAPKATGSLAEIVSSQLKACGELDEHPVCLLSVQLAAILEAAGVTSADV